jgi:hypothetical protein
LIQVGLAVLFLMLNTPATVGVETSEAVKDVLVIKGGKAVKF